MRTLGIVLTLLCMAAPLPGQEKAEEGPANEKAQKTFKEAKDYQHRRLTQEALDAYKKADKQDGGHCVACQKKMIKLGVELHDWKVAESGAQEMAEQAQGDKSVALAHYEFAIVLIDEGLDKHKDEPFARAHEELTKALAAAPKFPSAVFADGRTLAHLKQDDAAKARFEEFVKMQPEDNPERKRALRYIDEPFWRAPEWLQHSPSRPPTASGFRWTISPERSC